MAQNDIIPNYAGSFSVDDMLQGIGNDFTGQIARRAADDYLNNSNNRGKAQGILDWFAGIFRTVIYWLQGLIAPNSREAEVGTISQLRDRTDYWSQLDQLLGADKIGKSIEEAAEAELRDAVGLFGMSKGESGRNVALERAISLRNKIIQTVDRALSKDNKLPGDANKDRRAQIAEAVATSVTGLTAEDAAKFAGTEGQDATSLQTDRNSINPTKGFAKQLLDITAAVGTQGVTYNRSLVPPFNPDMAPLNAVPGLMTGAGSGTLTPDAAMIDAVKRAMEEVISKEGKLTYQKKYDLNNDGKFTADEAAIRMMQAGTTAATQVTTAKLKDAVAR